jgi:hypothetical protein
LEKLHLLLYRHSGLDPWFDRLTTLSKVEGESSTAYRYYISGCRIAKSGQTAAHQIRPAFMGYQFMGGHLNVQNDFKATAKV